MSGGMPRRNGGGVRGAWGVLTNSDGARFGRQVDVLEGRAPGQGHSVHLWVSPTMGRYWRLCDGVGWDGLLATVDLEPAHLLAPCVECWDIADLDLRLRSPRLNVLARSLLYLDDPPPTVPGPRPVRGGSVPWSEDEMASPIPLSVFARFYAASDDHGKARVVRRFRADRDGGGGNYYQPVLTLFRNTHWQNGHLQDLADSIRDFIQQQEALDAEKPNRRNRSANYATVLARLCAIQAA